MLITVPSSAERQAATATAATATTTAASTTTATYSYVGATIAFGIATQLDGGRR